MILRRAVVPFERGNEPQPDLISRAEQSTFELGQVRIRQIRSHRQLPEGEAQSTPTISHPSTEVVTVCERHVHSHSLAW